MMNFASANQTSTNGSAAETLMRDEFPLHRSCRDGDDSTLYSLLTSGRYSIFTEDSFFGWTPVHWAARYDHAHCFDILVKQTSFAKSCDIQVSGTRQTPLHVAAEFNAANAVRWLLQRGADINQKDYMGETALHKCARSGFLDIIILLSNFGTGCSVQNLRGETAFDLARISGFLEAANYLYQILHTSQSKEIVDDSDMEMACDYHNSVNIPRATSSTIARTNGRPKRTRPTEEDTFNKRARLSGGGDFIPNLNHFFGESPLGGGDDDDDDDDDRALPRDVDNDQHPTAVDPPTTTFLAIDEHDVEGNRFLGNGMKTISSRINGNHAAVAVATEAAAASAMEVAAGEDESTMDEALEEHFNDETDEDGDDDVTRSVSSVGSLPPHLIPPLLNDDDDAIIANSIGIPLGVEARLDGGGKPGRSKCVWFRSSCYI